MTITARRARLLASLGFLEIRWRGLKPDAAGALERWLYSWPGLGAVVAGMQAQGFDVEVKQYPGAWRARVDRRHPGAGGSEAILDTILRRGLGSDTVLG